MNRTTLIIDRCAAFTIACIMMMPDLMASARVVVEQPWNTPMNMEHLSSPKTAARTESLASSRNNEFSTAETEAFEVRLVDQHVAYLNGHSHDALNKPTDDVFEFEITGGAKKNVKVRFESDAQDLGITINGQRYLRTKDGEVVFGKEYLRSGTNTLMFSPTGELPIQVKNVEVSSAAEMATAERILTIAQKDNFTIESSEVMAFSLAKSQTAAIPYNMSNVTRGAVAYRSGEPAPKVISVRMAVNRDLSESNLRQAQIMYFDYGSKSWKQAFTKSIDHAAYVLEADVPGGTDYFAALIKTPEMPEAAAFMPTAISDLEPKSPAEGITLIQPPSANQQGDANISYPLSIPAGRQGMTPQIALNYSSSGGESWCGYGWNISMPSISIDSRWGVPRYDDSVETEVYTLNGESLHEEGGLKANRPQLVNNKASYPVRNLTGAKQFFQKIKSAYQKIERKGTSTTGYFWVVTDANQTKQYYGTRNGTSLDTNSVLRDPVSGNIAQWFITRTADKWGNFIDYTYSHQYPGPSKGLRQGGVSMYPKAIRYTGHGNTLGNYRLEFVHGELQGFSRGRISMNNGFKVVDDKLLLNVQVYYQSNKIREFKPSYDLGDFDKVLLSRISEWRNGSEFYSHTFSYNKRKDEFISFSGPEVISINTNAHTLLDQLAFDYLANPLHHLITPSLLKSTTTLGWTAGGGAGLGLTPSGGFFKDKSFTLSGKLNYSESYSRDKYSLQDMNADGIPDLVIDKRFSNQKKYLPLSYENGHMVVGSPRVITSSRLFSNASTSINTGFDFVLPWNVAYYGQNWNFSKSKSTRYLIDYNGDGVLDQVVPTKVNEAEVHFGSLSSEGTLSFHPNSLTSLSPVFKGEAAVNYPETDLKEFEVVRTWTAPVTGTVLIGAPPLMNPSMSGNIKVSIQKNNTFVQSPTTVQAVQTNYFVSVAKGDLLMFRATANESGFEDWMQWNPSILYTSPIPTDGNFTHLDSSNSSRGFVLSGAQSVMFQGDDLIKVTLNEAGTDFSDDIFYRVTVNVHDTITNSVSTQVFTSKKPRGNGAFILNSANFFSSFANVPNTDSTDACQLIIEAFSHSNIDWDRVSFRPKVEIKTDCYDDPIVSFPVVGLNIYNNIEKLNGPTSVSLSSGNYNAIPNVLYSSAGINNVFSGASGAAEHSVYLTVKSDTLTISKREIVLSNASSPLGSSVTQFAVNPTNGTRSTQMGTSYSSHNENVFNNTQVGNSIHLEFFSAEGPFSEKAIQYVKDNLYNVKIVNASNQTITTKSKNDCNFFYRQIDELGSHYKGWGQFIWNGDHSTAIHPDSLHLPGMQTAQNQTEPFDSTDDMSGHGYLSPWGAKFSMMVPVRGENAPAARDYIESICPTMPAKDHWSIFGTYMGIYRYSGNIATGVFGEDIPDPEAVVPDTGSYSIPAVFNVTKSKTLTYSAGVGFEKVGGLGGSWSELDAAKYYSRRWKSFQDFNGDGFADIISEKGDTVMAQFTNPGGDHNSPKPLLVGTELNKSISDDHGVSANGNFPNEDTRFIKDGKSLNASASHNWGSSDENVELFDFNGDGLVDRVTHGSTNQLIALNNGYGFDAPIAYSDGYNDSYSRGNNSSTALGLNQGVQLQKLKKVKSNLGNSWSAGISINNVGSHSKSMPIDLNADGLSDLIISSHDTVQIFINDGLYFNYYSTIYLNDIPNRAQGFGISGNVGGTMSFDLFWLLKLSLSANGGANYAVNEMRSSFMDMNGDGAVDFVKANEMGELQIYFSNVQKSNLLIGVHNPLGGSFQIEYDLMGHKMGVHKPVVKTDKGNDAVLWDMPSGKWAMRGVAVFDGFNIANSGIDYDGVDTTRMFFEYDGGIQGRREKAFNGFTRVQTRHQNQLGSESSYPKRYLTETVEYFAPTSLDFEARNRHEYLKGLVKNNYSLLHEQQSGNSPEVVTVISRQTSEYDFRIVNTSGANIGTIAGAANDWTTIDWTNKQETQTVFPAVVATEAVNYPVKNDQVNYHSQLFELRYDKYFNVVRYEDKGYMTVGTPSIDTVDIIVDEHYEYLDKLNLCSSLYSMDTVMDGMAIGYIATSPNYDNDTLWIVPSTGLGCTSELYSLNPCASENDTIYSHHRKLVIDIRYITQTKLNAQYSTKRIAIMTYQAPSASVGNRTNALSKHEIYLDTVLANNLVRSSEVVSYTTGGEAMDQYKVLLNDNLEYALSDLTYDGYGNVTTVTGAENHQGLRANSSFDYDNVDHQFVNTITNQFGESICSNYDHNTGNLLRTVGINGHAMQYQYDNFDRIRAIFAPRELADPNSPATIEYEYYLCGQAASSPSVALTIHNNEFSVIEPDYNPPPVDCNNQSISRPSINAGAPTTSTFVDGNGQALQVKSYKKNNSGADGFLVSGFQTLNKFGKPAGSYEDFLSTAAATAFVSPISGLDLVVNNMEYDYQYRQISSDNYVAYNAGSNAGQWVSSTIEYGFDNLLNTGQPEFYTRTTVNSGSAKNNPTPNSSTSEYVDARGRKIGVIQHGPSNLITKFDYNAIGELMTVTDPIGEVTQYTYDLAGRQLFEDHSDRGLSTLTYDKASNVIEMTNPATASQNDKIKLGYDYNRLISKIMPQAGGAPDLYNVDYIYGSLGDGNNGAGRIVTIVQGGSFKIDELKYDELGQVAQEVKTIDVPNVGQRVFTTNYRYDSFGRMLKAIYPDGDEVNYKYYPSGELSSISSDLFGDVQSIVESINYDGRGNIDEMVYGNGTITNYEYADRTWTLMGSMVIGKPVGGSTAVSLLDRTYSYNSLGGIGTMQRVMDQSLVQPGETDHTFNFSYDSYNRLLEGKLDIAGVGPSYEVSTNFNDAGGITSKFSKVEPGTQTLSNNAAAMSYDLVYNYNPANPHQLEEVVDQMSSNTQHFTYNASGSIKQIQDNSQTQDFFWNEEQWLNAVQNEQGIHHYIYDHTGERIMKSSVIQSSVYVNDQVVNTIQDLEPYTLYVNPYFVITEFSNADKVSKHYYMGSQRVASELAVQSNNYSPLVNEPSTSGNATFTQESYNAEKSSGSTLGQILESPLQPKSANLWLNNLNEALTEFGEKTLTLEETQKKLPTIESIYPDLSPQTNYKTASTQRVFYWYHPDYIGNVDLVTDLNGEAYELFLYNPWGENLYEWNSGTSSWSSPYRFNGKELDQETGLAYYGARYYDNQLSMWLSVDPMAMGGHNISMAPYHFSSNNPVMRIDPNGMMDQDVGGDICPTCPVGSGYDAFRNGQWNYEYDPNSGQVTALGGNLKEVNVGLEGYSNKGSLDAQGSGGNANYFSVQEQGGGQWLNSPVGDAPISSEFMSTRTCSGCSNTHGGTDYAVPIGTPVVATASGTVARAYRSGSYGNTVIVDHGASPHGGGNVYTLYAHGNSIEVQQGARVNVRDLLINSGNTGRSTGPHLHYEVIVSPHSPSESQFFGNLQIRHAPLDLGYYLGY